MDLNDMKLSDIRALLDLLQTGGRSHSLRIGEAYFIRTVTYHYTGRVAAVTDSDIILDDAACIFDSGRWAQALTEGQLAEVEPFPGSVIISRASIVDATAWCHPLPREVK